MASDNRLGRAQASILVCAAGRQHTASSQDDEPFLPRSLSGGQTARLSPRLPFPLAVILTTTTIFPG